MKGNNILAIYIATVVVGCCRTYFIDLLEWGLNSSSLPEERRVEVKRGREGGKEERRRQGRS